MTAYAEWLKANGLTDLEKRRDLEPVEKHPGHPDQSVHSGGYGRRKVLGNRRDAREDRKIDRAEGKKFVRAHNDWVGEANRYISAKGKGKGVSPKDPGYRAIARKQPGANESAQRALTGVRVTAAHVKARKKGTKVKRSRIKGGDPGLSRAQNKQVRDYLDSVGAR